MKSILPMPTQAGSTVSIEITDDSSAGPVMRGAAASSILDKSAQSFEQAISTIRPAALAPVQQFADLAEGIDSVRVKFAIKINAAAGAIIASAGSEANFEVEVHWAAAPRK